MKWLANSRLLFWSAELLIVATLIWVCTQISFLFSPIGIFLSVVFTPLLLSGILFYLLNPLVKLLERIRWKRLHFNRTAAVILVFIGLIAVIGYGAAWVVPKLVSQVTNLVGNIPDFARSSEAVLKQAAHHPWLQQIDFSKYLTQLQNSLAKYAEGVMSGITSGIGTVVGTVTSVTVTAVTVPVMLFYMLKDGEKLMPAIRKLLPERHADQTIELLSRMNATIARYIGGQILECLFVGTFTAFGYMLIGEKYALLLGVFAGLCNLIPYVGPYIGILPALIVAFTISTNMVLYVIIVVVVVQQVDGNLVYPNIIGRTLRIHPLTIIIILLAAGNIAGLLGMILAIPLYAVVKTVVQYLYSIWQLEHPTISQKNLKK
ncbi:AI-2E family transporter [Levilactobacillus acidifarinae]|uniref:Permease n=1 Tax=Levilactobacillus acidifarinae DSM 19394 = JCM 15949 TaxID=1423715 RepID=A0A0R1LLQ4_9LACO|nr:AI-2E family transporter [Levilactobacillus acidifarinae]KRK96797.1 permease [Levilactobacillus acidifarinae DSM 19394]GEO69835.1 AI-2E family transporter [Levilactobacillus acidifarinae]